MEDEGPGGSDNSRREEGCIKMSVLNAPEIIDSLRAEFIQEATNAPKLFKDLAKVEHYIAESYKSMSFQDMSGINNMSVKH